MLCAVSASPSLTPEGCFLLARVSEAAVSIRRSGGASTKRCYTLMLRSQPGLDTFFPHLQQCRYFLSICSMAVWLLHWIYRVQLSLTSVS